MNTKNDESQFNMLKELEISFEQQKELKKYAENRNIEFLSTGFDLSSIKFLNKLNIMLHKKRIKLVLYLNNKFYINI